MTAEREVATSIPGAEGTSFALQTGKPSGGLDDPVEWRSRLQ